MLSGWATQAILLGFDFMRQTHVIIDVGHRLLNMGEINIPVLQATDFIPKCCNIADAIVPRFSEMIVPVQVESPVVLDQLLTLTRAI